jgi:hydrogenase maturation protease
MVSGTVVFGYGNPSQGDDALGPMLLERLETWLEGHPELAVIPVADFQLQIEHALDLQGADLALFLDADMSCASPFALRRAVPSQDTSYSSHALSPEAVLHVCREVNGTEPPPSFILSIRGERFELGEPLSAAAASNLEAAWTFVQKLLRDGRAETWEAAVH